MPLPRQMLFVLACLFLQLTVPHYCQSAENLQSVAKVTTQKTVEWLNSLTDDQQEIVLYPFESDQRLDWHFIPKTSRKGLTLREMTTEQQEKAYQILAACLSETGYNKTRQVMKLEKLLYAMEPEGKRERRDSQKFYFTLFGDPRQQERWGLSVEGHHVSLNFVFEGDQVLASTPQFLAANPAIIKTENDLGFALDYQVLQHEQELAFALVNSLDAEQKQQAIIATDAPKEIRHPGVPQPPQEKAVGLAAAKMTAEQQQLLQKLISEYAHTLPKEVADKRLQEIEAAGFDNIHFAWAGPTELGIGHYYRVQGSNFLIEFVNYQEDVAGNPANHIHSVWRNLPTDFGVSAQ